MTLPPESVAEVQRLLDEAARRAMLEELNVERAGTSRGQSERISDDLTDPRASKHGG